MLSTSWIMTYPRILLAGDWQYSIYEASLARGFEEIGCVVTPCALTEDRSTYNLGTIMWRLRLGRACKKIEEELLNATKNARPDILFLNRPTRVRPRAIASLRQYAGMIFQYHNDNPFVGAKNRIKCRHYRAAIKFVDHVFGYRPKDIGRLRANGARSCSILPPYYDPSIHFPCTGVQPEYDVVFIGHFERDGRDRVLHRLARQEFSLLVAGPPKNWSRAPRQMHDMLKEPIKEEQGRAYAETLARARLGLVFLSSKNRDVYTRRCIEIPACGVPALMPRSPELERIFERCPKCLFTSEPELQALIRYYLEKPNEREVLMKRQYEAVVPSFGAPAAAQKIVTVWRDLEARRGTARCVNGGQLLAAKK